MTRTIAERPERPKRPWHKRRRILPALLGLTAIAAVGSAVIAGGAFSNADDDTPIGPPILRYRGVNFAGAEFNPRRIPGIPSKDYVYPNRATVAPFLSLGMNAARLPIRWERLQPAALALLDRGELRRIDDGVRALAGHDLIVIDLHNYARYRGVVLDDGPDATAALADVWRQLATHFQGNPRIAFGMMNEPNGLSASTWRNLAQTTIVAIRKTGAKNLVLVPGVRWTGAHSWTQGPDSNGTAFQSFQDPGHNFAFEMHQYLDRNSSGASGDCVDPDVAAGRLTAATRWLRQIKARGFLAEFGAPPSTSCLAALDSLMDKIDRSSDVWLGWTYWAAGSWWGTYPMSVQPDRNGPKPQTGVLSRHIPRSGA